MDVETPLHPSVRRRRLGSEYIVPKAFMDIQVSLADLGDQSVFARRAMLDLIVIFPPLPLALITGV